MEKISSFQITGLELSGFKCFKDPVRFDFGGITNILGSIHVGKSSIADAIAFAITGTTFWGGGARIEKLYNEQRPSIEIQMELIDQDGVRHTLARRRKNDKMTTTLDTYKVTQANLNEWFGDRDAVLSILNPLYFTAVLQDSGRSLLERCLPAVAHEQVLAGFNAFDRNLLKDVTLLSP